MRATRYLMPTLRDDPADAVAVSHRLLVRAGMTRQVGAGLWTWLPLGWRSLQRAVAIVREEMDRIGGQEMLMPVLLPAELWKLERPLRHRRAVQAEGPRRVAISCSP